MCAGDWLRNFTMVCTCVQIFHAHFYYDLPYFPHAISLILSYFTPVHLYHSVYISSDLFIVPALKKRSNTPQTRIYKELLGSNWECRVNFVWLNINQNICELVNRIISVNIFWIFTRRLLKEVTSNQEWFLQKFAQNICPNSMLKKLFEFMIAKLQCNFNQFDLIGASIQLESVWRSEFELKVSELKG